MSDILSGECERSHLFRLEDIEQRRLITPLSRNEYMKKILVIDDDHVIRHHILKILKAEHFEVTGGRKWNAGFIFGDVKSSRCDSL